MREAIARQTGQMIAPASAPRDVCGRIAELTHTVNAYATLAGMPVTVTSDVVTERSASRGLSRNGRMSVGGSCSMIRARDGWLAVNLARRADDELLPAWLECDVVEDRWLQVSEIARRQSRDALVARARLLGLAVAPVRDSLKPDWSIVPMGRPAKQRKTRPLVIDMSSLWAGPLCGALLAEAGADVVKLESTRRPDGIRFGDPQFFARLNGRKRPLMLDLPRERAALRALFATADIVIESARPRVLAQWGYTLPDIFAINPHLIWISITAYGREGERGNWIGYGDDVATAAGLVTDSDTGPTFVGDAIADPLTGLSAAASAFACLAAGGGFLVDANLYAAASFVANAERVP
jgi:hypothetical protein